MEKEIQKILEFDRIREMLAGKAATIMGKKLAESLSPAAELSEIEARLTETAEAEAVLAWASPPFGGIFDLTDSLKKAGLGATLDEAELTDVLSTLWAMRAVKNFFRAEKNDLASAENQPTAPNLRELAMRLEILGELEKVLAASIDEHGNLRDTASPELARVRRDLRLSTARIKEKMAAIVKDGDYQKFFQEAIVTMRDERYVIPVKQEYRYRFPGIIHDQSASGATLFIEPLAVAELNNDVKQLTLAEKQEVERILRRLTEKVNRVSAALKDNLAVLARLDFDFAKAKLAADMRAVRPLINQEGRTKLLAARHPLIDPDVVVPIDLTLGNGCKMLLITGPNTGGKTVSMKTVGLLSLMAQAGLFIPAAQGSELGVYASVYADIGDEQSIEQSLSTFSAHMTRLVSILNKATADDLLLLDEIGAGTDPEEGAALAMAILEHLLTVGASVMATTHYTALKTFAFREPGMENACVEFDAVTLKPTYRLLVGMPGASNAFAISGRLGLSSEIISRAGELIEADHAHFEQVVSELEREKMRFARLNADIGESRQKAAAMEREATALKRELSENKGEIIRKAKEQSAAIIRRARREAEEVIKELKEQFDDHGVNQRRQAIEAARKRLNEAADRVAPGITSQKNLGQRIDTAKIQRGDFVYVAKLDQRGTVLSCKGKELEVQIGALRLTVKAADCRFLGAAVKEKEPTRNFTAAGLNLGKTATIKREIDIRGMMVDEAESVLSKYIDDAQIGGLKQILIIHGKGTGALRKGVHAYLAQHKSVVDYQFADIDEGGTGATVAELK